MTGTELRAWMTRHHYSIHRLADTLGIHASTVQRYRDGSLKVPRLVELALPTLVRSGE